jgi:hypothetical protein
MALPYSDWFVGELKEALNAYVDKAWVTTNEQALIDYFHRTVDVDQTQFKLLSLGGSVTWHAMPPAGKANMTRWLQDMYGSCTGEHRGRIGKTACEHGEAYVKWEERLRSIAIMIEDSDDDETPGARAQQMLDNTDPSCSIAGLYHVIHKTGLMELVFEPLQVHITSIMKRGVINLSDDTCLAPPKDLQDLYLTKTNKPLMKNDVGLQVAALFKSVTELSPKLEQVMHIAQPIVLQHVNLMWSDQRWFNEVMTRLARPTGQNLWTWTGVQFEKSQLPPLTNPSIQNALVQFGRLVTYLGDCKYIGIVAGTISITWHGAFEQKQSSHCIAFVRIADDVQFYNWGKSCLGSVLAADLQLVRGDKKLKTKEACEAATRICLFLMDDTAPFMVTEAYFVFEYEKCPHPNNFNTIAEMHLDESQIKRTRLMLTALIPFYNEDVSNPTNETEVIKWLEERDEMETHLLQWYIWYIPGSVELRLPARLFRSFNAHWIQPEEQPTDKATRKRNKLLSRMARSVYDQLIRWTGGCMWPATCLNKAVRTASGASRMYCAEHGALMPGPIVGKRKSEEELAAEDRKFGDWCV